ERTQVLESCPVRRIDLEGDRPTILTDNHRIVADRLIVTAGAWTKRLVPQFDVPLTPTRQQVLYFRPSDPLPYNPGRFPVFIYKGNEELDAFYGMPEFLGMGVKVARHGGPELDPDSNDPEVGDAYREVVRSFLRKHIPGVADSPIDRTEACIYTVAPEEAFRVAPLADCPKVIMASPCSGHGFKFSCLIGSVLADLATLGQTAVAIDAWAG
ncbi:FAD-dependent oxidoreductase, partial [Singulisphaera rosea]